MDKKTQALKLALEALEEIALAGMSPAPEMIDSKEAFHARQAWRFIGIAARQLTAIREALADQPAQQQEPVAWYHAEDYKTHFTSIPSEDLIESGYWKPLYTSPQPSPSQGDIKPWVGLTQEDWMELKCKTHDEVRVGLDVAAKLREKNEHREKNA